MKAALIAILFALAIILTGCLESEKPEKSEPIQPTPTPCLECFSTQLAVFEDNNLWIAQVIFTLPNPCHEMHFLGMEKSNNIFVLNFNHILPDPNIVCIQVVQSYNETIELGRLESGSYEIIVIVNDTKVNRWSFNVSSQG
jgi:hypothetical protein